jgi:cytochrome c oxidase assembly factor CtaG
VLSTIAHLAPPLRPGDIWGAWSTDPLAWLLLVGAVAVHVRGWQPHDRHPNRRLAFLAAVAVAALALVSPLDALSSSLASAHMVQHLLLTTVVAPLLVVSAPTATLLRGLPRGVRSDLGRIRRTSRFRVGRAVVEHPVLAATAHVVALWVWHAGGPYELALRNDLVHRLQHVVFLLTAVAAWAVVGAAARRRRDAPGVGVLVLFVLSVQGSLLGALLTFAGEPWYPAYGERSAAWDLTPIEDQQLAGLVMWVPGGVTYLVAALALLGRWVFVRPPSTPGHGADTSAETSVLDLEAPTR